MGLSESDKRTSTHNRMASEPIVISEAGPDVDTTPSNSHPMQMRKQRPQPETLAKPEDFPDTESDDESYEEGDEEDEEEEEEEEEDEEEECSEEDEEEKPPTKKRKPLPPPSKQQS